MCLGVPGRVVELAEAQGGLEFAVVDFGGLRRKVCTACVPSAGPGDYVIVHAGIAISQVDQEEAARVLELLREIGEIEEPGGADATAPEATREVR